MQNSKLIVGLGNPGNRYSQTRHNIGFMIIDELTQRADIQLKEDTAFRAFIGKGNLAGQPVILAKPQTFMNLSGQAVADIAHFFKIQAANIFVIHDDLDIIFGTLAKLTFDQSAAGHNGVISIIERLGTQAFHRLRIGIANEQLAQARASSDIDYKRNFIEDFVVKDFLPEEQKHLPTIINQATDILTLHLSS